MTNREAWNLYTKGLSSPDNFLAWSLRYIIAASLQRRVWIPSGEFNLYPNIYPILVAEPGIGKGLAIKAVKSILEFNKLDLAPKLEGVTEAENQAAQAILEQDKELSKDLDNAGKLEDAQLIPTAADAVTYEALLVHLGKCRRRINYPAYSEKHGRVVMKIHGHSSMAFLLEEMASLLRKNTESTVNLLLQGYDCPDKYEYRTKSQGIDRVLTMCINFLAGTTPEFMNDIFDDGLLSQGFSSRAFFIYAARNRHEAIRIPPLTPEQIAARDQLRQHVKKLSKLYGPVIVKEEDWDYIEKKLIAVKTNPKLRASNSPKLKHYYSRLNIHWLKVALCNHFLESDSMQMPRERIDEAIEDLHQEEKTMHLALSFTGSNPQAKMAEKIVALLRNGPQPYSAILIDCFALGTQKDIEEAISYLTSIGRITAKKETDPDTEDTMLMYRLAGS